MKLLSCHLVASSIAGQAHLIVYVQTPIDKDLDEVVNSVIHSMARTPVALNSIQTQTIGQRHLLQFLKDNDLVRPYTTFEALGIVDPSDPNGFSNKG